MVDAKAHANKENNNFSQKDKPTKESTGPLRPWQNEVKQSGSFSAGTIMHLQHTIGNQATMQMLTMNNNTPLQMKPAKLDAMFGAHMRDYGKDLDGEYFVKEDVEKGPKIKNRTVFETIEPRTLDESADWQMITFAGEKGFIRYDKIVEGDAGADLKTSASANKAKVVGSGEAFEEQDDAEAAGGYVADKSEIVTKGTGGKSDVLKLKIEKLGEDLEPEEIAQLSAEEKGIYDKNQVEKNKLKKEDAKISAVGNTFDTVSGLFGLGLMVKNYREASKENKSASDKGKIVFEGVENTQKSVAGISGMVDNIAKAEGKSEGIGKSDAAAGWSGSIGDALSAIKEGFSTVYGIYDLFKQGFSKEGITGGEALKGTLNVIGSALKSAQSVVKTVKSILEILKMGIGNLVTAIPGISIAISAVKITVKVYDMITAQISKIAMTESKKDFKDKYSGKGKEYVKKENSVSLFGKTLWTSKSKGTNKELLKRRKEELAAKAIRDEEEEKEREEIEQYELAKEMKDINVKRLVRGGLQVGLEMTSIAGDIATLTGAGATAGVPLKAAAAAAGTAMSLTRRAKQAGRDRAAKEDSWAITKAVFNADKSSDKKHGKRNKDAELLLSMIGKLPDYNPSDKAIISQYQRIEDYISASGCNPKELYAETDIDKQIKILTESMSKRE